METEIDESIKSRTIYCKKDFACLINSIDTCCEVVHVDYDLVFYVRPTYGDCPYKVPMGDFASCNCPVRREIYRRNNWSKIHGQRHTT